MKNPSQKRFYREKFDGVSEHHDKLLNDYAINRRIEFFRAHRSGLVVDVGSGSGKILSMLHCCEAFGADLSFRMVHKMKGNGINGFQSDAEFLPINDAVIDTAIGSEIIYYLDDPSRFLREAHRVLKPNGKLLLSSFNNSVRFYCQLRMLLRMIGLNRMYFDDGNKTFTTAKQLRRLMRQAGFREIEVIKVVLIPWERADFINRFLEKTFLRHAGMFIFVSGTKAVG